MLHPEQSYVFELSSHLGIEPQILTHKIPTKSCKEKFSLLKKMPEFREWGLEQVVKTLYFSRGNSHFVGIVMPELEIEVNPRDFFSKTLNMSKSKAERYWVNPEKTPSGMAWGTCTPFPLESSVGSEISHIIVIDYEPILNKTVDISIGGESEDHYRKSMHIPYFAIPEILKKRFGKNFVIRATI